MSEDTARDPRRSTFLKVHIRGDRGWTEAIVCNVSTHGIMLRGSELPSRGAFVEIASGALTVAGQVRWSLAGRCGIRIREMIDLGALLGDHPEGDALSAPAGPGLRERSSSRTQPARDGKALARTLDFALSLALLVGGAWCVGTAVTELLGKPMSQIDAFLAPTSR